MKHFIIFLVIVLLVAHQDYWNWNNDQLILGVFPMGLFYHVCISLAAALVWLLGVTFAWPKSFSDLDAEISSLAKSEKKQGEITESELHSKSDPHEAGQ